MKHKKEDLERRGARGHAGVTPALETRGDQDVSGQRPWRCEGVSSSNVSFTEAWA